ncbi:two-component regulator propeller domain-containing protein [Spirosoma soli]|uniref:histidine kinase n=1 Tax=Spirosoma soli TaxID=1770529 RepID=A0ABW5M847_9BACT
MKHPLLRYLLVWIINLAIGLPTLYAQYTIKHFTTKDGLSQGSVYYFLEDSRGYMWMTSQNGLNRLEGSRFRTYAHADNDPGSIGKGEVRGLVEAPNGDLWVGTEVCLSRYVRRTNRFQNYYLVDGRGKRQFSQNRSFFVDDSTVWFLNSLRGVLCFNFRRNKLYTLLPNVPYDFTPISREVVMDKLNGQLWLRLPKGLLRYDLRTKQQYYYLTSRTDDRIGKERVLYALCEGPGGSVWISTNKGVGYLKAQEYREYNIGINTEDDVVYTLTPGPDSLIWIGTSRSGILVMDPKTGQIKQQFRRSPLQANSLADNHISELFVDRKGWIWVNLDPKGVDLLYPISLKPMFTEDSPLDSTDFNGYSVRGIAQDKEGYLWAGTVIDGVRRINLATGQMKRYSTKEGLTSYWVGSIMCSSSGQVFIGTNGGLASWNPSRQRFTTQKIPNRADPVKANVIRNIYELTPSVYLLATSAGMYTIHHGQRLRYLYDSTSTYSGALYHDRENGLLFVGRRDRDLQCFSVRGTSIRHLYNTLPGYSPTSFHKQGEWLWIGTDNGLVKYHIQKRQVIRRFTRQDGLPDNSVFSLLPDADGDLWISTNHGLAIFDRKERFTVLPEMADIEFMSYAAYQTDADHLFFGTTTSLYQVHPSRIKHMKPPIVRLVQLSVNDQPANELPKTIDESDTLRLAYNQNNISIQVAALDYLSSIPPHYQYRLLGQSNQWINSEANPQIRYTNLSPGWYGLQVKALASNGLWTPAKTLSIYVDQPFWQRWWFQLLIAIGVLGLGYWLVKVYLHRKQQVQRRLTSQLMAAQESERHRIAQDLHDDVGNTLAAAKGILGRVVSQKKSPDVMKAQSLIEKAGQDLRTISHNLMPVEFETYALSYVVRQAVEKAGEASGIQFDFLSVGQEEHISPERSLVIYRIINELLNNILKHSGAQTASIQMLYQPESFVLTVEDDGHGFNKQNNSQKGRGIGLKNINSRANYLSARLEISSNESGTSIILEVPYD